MLAIGAAVIFGFMGEVTQILDAIDRGDSRAAERLLPLVYDELRRLASQKMAQEKLYTGSATSTKQISYRKRPKEMSIE